jgi:phage terminase large subunit GpA-like protein
MNNAAMLAANDRPKQNAEESGAWRLNLRFRLIAHCILSNRMIIGI